MDSLRCLILSVFIFWGLFCDAQPHHFTAAQREQQRQFIRQDTLPVFVKALPSTINSPFSEYNGILLPDSSFFFTSMKSDVEADYDHYFESSWYCKLYESRLLPDGSFEPVKALPPYINRLQTFNSNFCFNEDKTLLIYSRCTRTNTDELKCQLWQSEFKNNNWTKASKLPNCINLKDYSSTQPHLVQYSDYEVLYFASNRPDGIGGYDIWFSIKKGNSYAEPINAGPVINTEGNEATPFYDPKNRTIYFSSDEHLGIGDYDIFYSQGALSQWGEVSNMGIPFNSEYNDFYFTLDKDSRNGHFSSNRPHDDAESDTCCNDIFHFQWKTPKAESLDTISAMIADTLPRLFPVTLYFENDQPNPHSISDTTAFDYPTLFRQYLSVLSTHTSTEIHQFLTDSIAYGFRQLQLLSHYLRAHLENGDDIELSIYGFASPLHHSDYNHHLSARRIVSFLNYLSSAEDGFFVPYIQKKKKGLTIATYPEGAVLHQFNSTDVNETVYGIQAMRDRKIRILPIVKQASDK